MQDETRNETQHATSIAGAVTPTLDPLGIEAGLSSTLPVTVTANGQTTEYRLRDDTSSAVVMRGMQIEAMRTAMNDALDAGDMAAAEAAQARYDATLWFVFRAIFRNSYPDIGDQFLRDTFTSFDQWQVVMVFFTRLTRRSSDVTIGGPSRPTETEKPLSQAASQAANREERRAHRKPASLPLSTEKRMLRALGD